MKTLSELNVLIIEDNQVYGRQLENWIKSQVNKVTLSPSSENGSYFVTMEKPDVIFLDNVLPGIYGIDVIEFFKEKCPESTLILMSSVFDLDEVFKALKIGADYVLDKKKEKAKEVMRILQASIDVQGIESSVWDFLKIKSFRAVAKRICIVENDKLFSQHLNWMLDRFENKYEVLEFSNIADFQKNALKQNRIDVVFSDFYLPDGNGEDIAKIVASSQKKCEVVMFSRKIDFDMVISMNLEGVTEYILKDENWKLNLNESIKRLKL